jgi:hypothetical protein
VEHSSNLCNVKITEEGKRIHTEEFQCFFVEIREDEQLHEYLLWKMIKKERRKKRRLKTLDK